MKKILPDYGKYYSENFGNEVVFYLDDLEIRSIAYIDNDLYSITQGIVFDEEYCITFDFDQKRLKQLLKTIEDKNKKSQLKKALLKPFTKIEIFDFQNSPIYIGISALPGSLELNQNEEYIPFIIDEFIGVQIIEEKETAPFIPEKITHIMMNKDIPVGFAIEDTIDKSDDKNILNAWVCYPELPDYCCENGAVYLFKNYEEAKKSLAFQLMGNSNYAINMSELDADTFYNALRLWISYESEFRSGFGYRNIKL